MNEILKNGLISEEDLILQEIDAFTLKYGRTYSEPTRCMQNINKKVPAVCYFASNLRNAKSGKQAHNVYLGRQNAGKGFGPFGQSFATASVKRTSHVAPSNSAFQRKSVVPIVTSGVIVNFIEILLKSFPKITKVRLSGENSTVCYVSLIFDQKTLAPGAEKYGNTLFGVAPPITSEIATNLCCNGYSNMLKSLLKEFNDNQRTWIKNGEVFMLQLLDKTIAVPVAVYYISTSSSAEDVEQRVFEVLDYVTACSNCLEAAKDKRKPLRCDSFCKECFINKAVCAEHKDLFMEWQCDIRPFRI